MKGYRAYIYSLHKATLFTLQQMGYKNTEIVAKSEKNRRHLWISAKHKKQSLSKHICKYIEYVLFWKNNNDDEREMTHKQHHNIPLSDLIFKR